MSLYADSVPVFVKMLGNLSRWLDKAKQHAEAKKFDPNVLLAARLAPDQFPLVRQVQAGCDAAKLGVARLTGKDAPKHPDTESTIDELKKRIEESLAFIESVGEKDFEGAETRKVPLNFMPGKGLLGLSYLEQLAMPNFFFHLTHAYAILRHNGVELGKADYLGGLDLIDL